MSASFIPKEYFTHVILYWILFFILLKSETFNAQKLSLSTWEERVSAFFISSLKKEGAVTRFESKILNQSLWVEA